MDADKKRIWIRGQFVEVTDEVYRAYMQGDRKMRYFENDLKTERFVLGKEGQVAMAGKARGLPGAYVALFKKIDELGGISPDFATVAGYSASLREVQPIQNYFRDTLDLPEPLVRQIGCVIGTHAGPGAFGLAFFDKGLVLE